MTNTTSTDSTQTEHDAPDAIVVREGASLHTADELVLIYVSDAVSLGAELSSYGTEALSRLSESLAEDADPISGCGWFAAPEDHDEAVTLANQVESDLSTLGYVTDWLEGYTIRPVCPVCHDEDDTHVQY